MLRRLMLAGAGAPPSGLVGLIASLSPAMWARFDDNAPSSAVVNSAVGGSAGALYAAVPGSALALKNTDSVSAIGLAAGTAHSFNIGASSLVVMPDVTLSNAAGWTFFTLLKVVSAPSAAAAVVCQLTGIGGGVPELDVLDVGGGKFRFRVMASGTGEIGMTATPTFNYGTKLAIVMRKAAGGLIDLFVDGALVASSSSIPGFSYLSNGHSLGGGRFGSTVNYYSVPGCMDESVLWAAPLADANCLALTA